MNKQFNKAFESTMGHEGGYVSDPDDAGGETYRGVSRRYHPHWPGWYVIDYLKKQSGFPDNLTGHANLQEEVRCFYKREFWDCFRGDKLASITPSLALEMFDTAVNMGAGRAVMFLQEALNSLNRDQSLFPDLVVDGGFGSKSMSALTEYGKHDKPELLLKVMNVLQGHHYLEYMGKDHSQEKYARGWFNRVTL